VIMFSSEPHVLCWSLGAFVFLEQVFDPLPSRRSSCGDDIKVAEGLGMSLCVKCALGNTW
jgi:hypothetical protein